MALRTSQQARRQVDALVRSMQPSFFLEFAAEDPKETPIVVKFKQKPYQIPPGGFVEIRDVWYVKAENAYDKVRKGREPVKDRKGETAADIVAHILSVAGHRGVFLRTGDAIEDAKLRAVSRKAARLDRMQKDERIVGQYHQEIADFQANPRNKDRTVREMKRYERDAMARLHRMREQEVEVLDESRITCAQRNCGYWAAGPEAQDEMATHRKATGHGTAPTAATSAPTQPGQTLAIEQELPTAEPGLTAAEQAEADAYEAAQSGRRRKRQQSLMDGAKAEREAEEAKIAEVSMPSAGEEDAAGA